MAHGRRARPLARRIIRPGLAFQPTLNHLGITRDASTRAAVGRVVGRLANASRLPEAEDVYVRVFLTHEPDREVLAYARRVLGMSLWVVYQFDDEELALLAVTDRRPKQVD